MSNINIKTPLTKDIIKTLKAGDMINLTGAMYTARDAAHKRLVEMHAAGKELPITLKDEIIFYAGPSPTKPGEVVGSIGPTTSTRMDAYSPTLLDLGLICMIGKGRRNDEVVKSIIKHGAIYLIGIGGAAAAMSECVTKLDVIAFEDLGTESIKRIEVVDMPLIVAIDCHGNTSLVG